MQQQTVTLIGHLTAEPFYREFDTGRKFARFRLGTSRRVRRFADNSAHYEERGVTSRSTCTSHCRKETR